MRVAILYCRKARRKATSEIADGFFQKKGPSHAKSIFEVCVDGCRDRIHVFFCCDSRSHTSRSQRAVEARLEDSSHRSCGKSNSAHKLRDHSKRNIATSDDAFTKAEHREQAISYKTSAQPNGQGPRRSWHRHRPDSSKTYAQPGGSAPRASHGARCDLSTGLRRAVVGSSHADRSILHPTDRATGIEASAAVCAEEFQ